MAMAILSAISILVTVVGIVFVAQTLDVNRIAVDKAAEANAISRDIGEAQVRAYISPLAPAIGFDERLRPNFRIRLANTGNSPALWLIAQCQIVFGPLNLDDRAECRPAQMFIGSLAASEETQDINFRCDAPLSIHDSAQFETMAIRVQIDLEWQNVFNREDGASCSYVAFIKYPLSEKPAVILLPEGMMLGRRLREQTNVFAGADILPDDEEDQQQS